MASKWTCPKCTLLILVHPLPSPDCLGPHVEGPATPISWNSGILASRRRSHRPTPKRAAGARKGMAIGWDGNGTAPGQGPRVASCDSCEFVGYARSLFSWGKSIKASCKALVKESSCSFYRSWDCARVSFGSFHLHVFLFSSFAEI